MENLIIQYLIPIMGSFLSFLALMLTRKLLVWLQVKLNIASDDKFQRDLEATVKDAIFAAEEKAATIAKSGLPKWTSGMKYKWAVDFIGNRFPQLSPEEADAKINAMLGRTCGMGATPEKGETCDVKFSPIAEAELRKP